MQQAQDKVLQKVKNCCENEKSYQINSVYLIEKAQSGDELFL